MKSPLSILLALAVSVFGIQLGYSQLNGDLSGGKQDNTAKETRRLESSESRQNQTEMRGDRIESRSSQQTARQSEEYKEYLGNKALDARMGTREVSQADMQNPGDSIRRHLEQARELYRANNSNTAAEHLFAATVLLRSELAASSRGWEQAASRASEQMESRTATEEARGRQTQEKESIQHSEIREMRREAMLPVERELRDTVKKFEDFNLKVSQGEVKEIGDFKDPYANLYRNLTRFHYTKARHGLMGDGYRTSAAGQPATTQQSTYRSQSEMERSSSQITDSQRNNQITNERQASLTERSERELATNQGADSMGNKTTGTMNAPLRAGASSPASIDQSMHVWNNASADTRRGGIQNASYHAYQAAQYFQSWSTIQERELDPDTAEVVRDFSQARIRSADPIDAEMLNRLGEKLDKNGIDVEHGDLGADGIRGTFNRDNRGINRDNQNLNQDPNRQNERSSTSRSESSTIRSETNTRSNQDTNMNNNQTNQSDRSRNENAGAESSAATGRSTGN